MNLGGVVVILLLWLGLSLENFLVQKNWSNPFLNGFYIFSMIFSSPMNVMFAVFILEYLFEYRILNIFDRFGIVFDGITNIATISLFIALCTFLSLFIYILWIYYHGFKISYQSLLDFSRMFIFRAPLLILTCGYFKPSADAGTDWTVPFLSHLTMMNGLYLVPLLMIMRKIREINFRKKNKEG